MFFLFGGGGRRFLAARLAVVAVFLVVFLAFHPHGTSRDILEGVRVALVVALVGAAWFVRRRRRNAVRGGDSNS